MSKIANSLFESMSIPPCDIILFSYTDIIYHGVIS